MEMSAAVSQFQSGYFAMCRRSPKTQTAYRIDLSQFQTHFGGTSLLSSIGVDSCEKWASELTSRKYAVDSIRRKFATLKVFFSYWVRKGVLDSSPLWKMRLDLGRAQRLPRSLTSANAKRLLEQAWAGIRPHAPLPTGPGDRQFLAFRNLAAVELLFATGMRIGELVSLRLIDWNDDDAVLLVNGKGGRQRLALLPDERSKRATRTYLAMRTGLNTDHNFIFINSLGRPVTTQGVARAITNLAERTAIDVHLTPHMIRHTVATLLLRNGADLRVVQEVLGHASISMTQRYTHVSKEHLRTSLQLHHPNNHLDLDFPWRERIG